MSLFVINENDNVALCLEDGHKYARRDIAAGSAVVKYGCPIGVASSDIAAGEKVHTHNMSSALCAGLDLVWGNTGRPLPPLTPDTMMAYQRSGGDVGIRNDVFIIPTVGCVNSVAGAAAERTGAIALTHQFGCSQLGDDLLTTRNTLRGLILHPNAGGVLVLGLGCENNRICDLRASLGAFDPERVRFLNCQDAGDEVEEAVRLIGELQARAALDRRVKVPVSKLRLGLKCGGSDGFSGVTANPLVGRIADRLVAMGGTAAMSEVPEMFGAEKQLLDRCVSEDVFDRALSMIRDFRSYYVAHGERVDENPSPGNRDGGITTLAEKSLGCVQKGGTSPVTDVLKNGDFLTRPGLALVDGPGSDGVSITNLTAAGCHMILFTTGRGTPMGAPVPTLKISTNTALAARKPGWIDFDAGQSLRRGFDGPELELWRLVLDTASGKRTKNELNSARDIAVFKNGVTL